MNLLEIKSLEKSFGSTTAVAGIELTVREGEVFGILGPNGAGKSTTLSMVSGLLKPDKGQVVIGGWDNNKTSMKAKSLIGLVPQEPALYEQLTARANLKYFGTINGVNSNKLKVAIDKVLEIVGLHDKADVRVSKFSGGMKRRLNIAAGLIHNPQLVIMDEPTVGIDPQSRNHILETVKELKNNGITVLYTSHYVEEVESLCDRVAIMDYGKVISQGTIPELLTKGDEYQQLIIKLDGYSAKMENSIQALPGVEQIFSLDDKLKILTANVEKVLPLAFETLVEHGLLASEIKIHKPNLESLFLKLTGRALRDY